jgi:ureidoglycolate hydrolase
MKIKKLDHKSIKPYGWVIDREFIKDNGRDDKFGVLLKERSAGWRIGYLILRKKRFEKLESHPGSLETFEPVKGRAIITLAPNKRPHKAEAFLLDRPVVLKKGVWHNVAAISKECEIKIFENIEVKTEYYYLQEGIS